MVAISSQLINTPKTTTATNANQLLSNPLAPESVVELAAGLDSVPLGEPVLTLIAPPVLNALLLPLLVAVDPPNPPQIYPPKPDALVSTCVEVPITISLAPVARLIGVPETVMAGPPGLRV